MPPIPALDRFYDLSLAGDAAGLLALFGSTPRIDTPLLGEVKGEDSFRRFVAAHQDWLTRHAAAPRLVNAILSQERAVLEWVLDLLVGEASIDLPVAMAADLEGGLLSALRIYHSTWPLYGEHRVRRPLLHPAVDLEEPAVIQAYMRGIAGADLEAVLALFVEDGYAREPSGDRYKYKGPQGLRQFYGGALSAGGIKLEHCTATFDGECCAIEFNAVEWAGVRLPPQAGIAVYELAAPDRLRAARIYDDVEPPLNNSGE
jgi:hypothetical protein